MKIHCCTRGLRGEQQEEAEARWEDYTRGLRGEQPERMARREARERSEKDSRGKSRKRSWKRSWRKQVEAVAGEEVCFWMSAGWLYRAFSKEGIVIWW